MKKVFISGPYTNGDTGYNVNRAIEVADILADLGFAPYVPHLTHFWHIMSPKPYEFWLELDKEFLLCCDCVLRLAGKSSGADAEVELAKKRNIPVYFSIEELVEAKPTAIPQK